jgi:integrase
VVGRRRKYDKGLPRRVYHRHGAFYYAAPDGKWHRLAADYPAALRAYATLVKSDDPPVTVEALIARYEVNVLADQAERTRINRRQQFTKIRESFGRMHPADITPANVWEFWEKRGMTPQAKKEIESLSTVLSYGRKVGALNHDNPCWGLKLPNTGERDGEAVYVTDAAYLFARDRAPPMLGHAMDLALVAGIDGATVRSLERRNITPDGLRFRRPKTDKDQLIDWNDELRMVVDAILREPPQLRRALICVTKGKRTGHALTLNGFQTAWQRLMVRVAKAGGQRFGFHDLRAKSASDAGSDEEARDRLGHQDVRTTVRHYRRLPRKATALRILDKPG